MKTLIFSDLHLEFHKDGGDFLVKKICANDADLVIIAGDFSQGNYKKIEFFIKMICDNFENIIYVPGNHEYYFDSIDNFNNKLNKLSSNVSNLFFLNNKKIKIGNKSYLGTTLWFSNNIFSQKNKAMLNDFKYINNFDPNVFDMHEKSVKFLEKNINYGDIVITHHTPSFKSIPARFIYSNINCYFSNDMDNLIYNKKPAIWFHGHTHNSFDYKLGKTRIICNPHGYLLENNKFSDRFIINI